nr:MAG TPA: hypothetical protein [Caudoviricetes sp.]
MFNSMYPMPPMQAMQQQTQQSIQYVNGIESANAYRVMPNQQVMLMDSNMPRFYIKTADASGFATVKAYDFVEAKQEKPEEYVKRSEFEDLKSYLSKILQNPSTGENKDD